MEKKTPPKLITKMASKKALKQNEEAIKSYDDYKKTADLTDRADIALGRKLAYRAATGSTLNLDIETHGTYSTTAHKI